MIEKSLRNYLMVSLLVAGSLFGLRAASREAVMIGCLPANGQAPAGAWMDGCASDQIGSFGLDMIWFDLKKNAVASIQNAKALIFGDSRILNAMSMGGASEWFANRHMPMYLLAFGAGEQSAWADHLTDRFHLAPELVIFDADPYFTGDESAPAHAIDDDPAGEEASARSIEAFLQSAPTYCEYLGWLCGRTQRFYRQYSDGVIVRQGDDRVWFNKNQAGSFPITPPGPADTSHYPAYLERARALLAKMHANPHCVVFTIVPNIEMDDTFARYLADHLGAQVVAPHLDNMATMDHYHLTQDSARRWSAAFFKQLAPIAESCVKQQVATRTP
jgi:hypothetical protein